MDEEARRELRRRKILSQAKTRINRILDAGNVSEEPCIDGFTPSKDAGILQNGNGYHNKLSEEDLASEDISTAQNADDIQALRPASAGTARLWYTNPRPLFALILGAGLRLLFFAVPDIFFQNLVVTWFIYEFVCEVYRYIFEDVRYPAHSFLADFFLSFGFSEKFIIFLGRCAEVLSRVYYDGAAIFFSFFTVHALIHECGIS